MTLPIINCPVSAGEVFRFIKKEGYAIIKGLTPSNVIKAVAGQLEPFFGQTPNCEGYFWGENRGRGRRQTTLPPWF